MDEFPTLDEINKEVGSLEPLDEEIKAKIDSLENNTTGATNVQSCSPLHVHTQFSSRFSYHFLKSRIHQLNL